MHRTDAPDHEVVGGLNRFVDQDLPGVPGTVLVANWTNAVQEELAAVIEAAGLTLSASGSEDATAGWGQLKKAIFESKALTSLAIAAGAVGTGELADNSVTSSKITANAVGSSELADGAVDTASIQDKAVATNKLADNSVTALQLADNAVDTAAIVNGSITEEKLAVRTLHGSFPVRLFQLQANGQYVSNMAEILGTAYWTKTPEGIVTLTIPYMGGTSAAGRDVTRYQIHAVDAQNNPINFPTEIAIPYSTARPELAGMSIVDISSSDGTGSGYGASARGGVCKMDVGATSQITGIKLFSGYNSGSYTVTDLPAYVYYFDGLVTTWKK